MRRNMPQIRCVAVEDLAATVDPQTGALSIGRVQPPHRAVGVAHGNGNRIRAR